MQAQASAGHEVAEPYSLRCCATWLEGAEVKAKKNDGLTGQWVNYRTAVAFGAEGKWAVDKYKCRI